METGIDSKAWLKTQQRASRGPTWPSTHTNKGKAAFSTILPLFENQAAWALGTKVLAVCGTSIYQCGEHTFACGEAASTRGSTPPPP